MNIKNISKDFDIIEEINYLSTASIGLVPISVIEKAKNFFVELTKGGTITLDEEKEVLVYEGLREEGAKLLNCRSNDIGVFNSVTEVLNIIAWSLDLQEGKLISTAIEFPSVTYPWIRLSRKEGLNIELVNSQNGLIPLDDLYESIDEHTKVVAISHVEFRTGFSFIGIHQCIIKLPNVEINYSNIIKCTSH